MRILDKARLRLRFEQQLGARAKATVEFSNKRYAVGIRKAMELGVKIAMGSDIYVETIPPATRGTESLATLYGYADAGMTALQAIQTATINAADLLGSAGLGSLEVGKAADLIAMDGDPLTDVRAIKKVWFVMKGATVMRNDRQR